MFSRPSNAVLAHRMRKLLAEGFHCEPPEERERMLAATKAWRKELWDAFKDCHRRLCPLDFPSDHKD